jgi:uncharacterized delta-60 repeat protein
MTFGSSRLVQQLWLLTLITVATFARLGAQETWTTVTTSNVQNLWGVCFGSGQFVAVGENGTILSSPDSRQWTARTSGTTRWLTAVCYSANAGLYIAVGGAGTVLSSKDAITWTPQSTPAGTPRLNAVNYAWGRFTAVGENASYLSSDDGVTWTKFSTGRSDFSGWLRGLTHTDSGDFAVGQDGYAVRWIFRGTNGQSWNANLGINSLEGVAAGRGTIVAVGAQGTIWRWSNPTATPVAANTSVTGGLTATAFANNQFVAVGETGTILTSDDGGSWTSRPAPTTQSLRAVAASDQVIVAVGFGGTIIRSDFAAKAPSIVAQPSDVTEQVGSAVAFSVSAAGSEPLSYQWRFNGAPLTGETSATLILPAVSLNQAGSYDVQVQNAVGSATSRAAQLIISSATLPTGLVDTAFAPAISNGTVRAVLPLADGRLIIGGDFTFTKPNGTVQRGIARLTADGQFDPSFDVGAGITVTPYTAGVTSLAQQADGRILVGGDFTAIGGTTQSYLARLTANGTVDANFTANALGSRLSQVKVLADGRILVANGSPNLLWLGSDGSIVQTSASVSDRIWPLEISKFDVAADGSVVAAGQVPYTYPTGSITRFNADGTVDSSFSSGVPISGPNAVTVRVLPDGSAMVAFQGAGGSRFAPYGPTVLWRIDGKGNASSVASMPNTGSIGAGAAYVYPDGRAILTSELTSNRDGAVRNSLLRFNPDGSIDNSFLVGPGIDHNAAAIAVLADGSIYIGGAFTTIAGVAQPRLARLHATGTNPNLPRILSIGPRYQEVRSGDPITISARAVGTRPIKFSWRYQDETGMSLNPYFNGSTTDTLVVPAADFRSTGYYSMLADGTAGSTTSDLVYVKVLPAAAPVITQSLPATKSVNVGRAVSLGVTTSDPTGVSYQWFFNGTAIAGATGSNVNLNPVTATNAGTYSVVLTNALGTARADTTLQAIAAPVLVNLSTRAWVGNGDATLIVGFSTDNGKSLIVRGVGPTLANYGVANPLADPKIAVYDSTGKMLAQNNDWRDAPGAPSQLQTGLVLPDYSKDAAYPASVSRAGGYTMQVSSSGPGNGVALGEIYEDSYSVYTKLTNLSARAFVGTGENVAIGGFTLSGTGKVRLLVRAVGPTLGTFGVSGVLANPVLTVFDSQGHVLATNDDWGTQSNPDQVSTVSASVGAFALPAGSHDAALLIELPAGSYTAQVGGSDGGTGVALLEIYEAP